MSMILLAVEDLERDAPVRDLLTAEGWWVTTVASKEEALRAAADHAPQLLVLDRGMDDTASLFKVFARAHGGCGVLVLVDSQSEEGAGDLGDGVVARDQPPEDLVATVRGSLDAPRGAQDSAPVDDEPTTAEEQLTSRELFGDILEDLGETEPQEAPEPVQAVEPAPGAAVEVPSGDEIAGGESLLGSDGPDAPEDQGAAELESATPEEPVETAGTGLLQDPAESSPEVAEEPIAEEFDEELPEVPEEPTDDPLVEVPVPPDVAESDRLRADLGEKAEWRAEPEGDAPKEVAAPDGSEAVPVPDTAQEDLVEASEQEDGSQEELGDIDAEVDLEPMTPSSIEIEKSLLTDLDPDDSEPTTDLVEEVADLLESGPEGWPGTDEPESGEGLSIEEALAVEEPVPGAEEEPEKGGEAERKADDEPESAAERQELERLGPYELIELAEFGDLTERWLARSTGENATTVILERVRPELQFRADVRDAFVEGNSDAAGWEHENVTAVVDLGRQDDTDYVATEYRPGHSLAEVLDRVARMEARMPLGVSLLLIERIAAALEVLAESPAISRHGWLVPGSIWLGENGEVLLREFGVGRLAAPDPSVVRDWTEHRFIAPEKWSDRGDIRSDLYSLGAVLYEMVSGQGVHRAADYEALVQAIQSANITPAQEVDPTIPSEVDAWMMRLLRRDPQERPQSVPEIVAKIDLALQALPARPASAELNAYVRQLFAARVPDLPAQTVQSPQSLVPSLEAESGAQAEAEIEAETDATPARRWEWWWLLIPLLALLSTFVGWKFMSGGSAGAELEDRERREVKLAAMASEYEPSAHPLAIE